MMDDGIFLIYYFWVVGIGVYPWEWWLWLYLYTTKVRREIKFDREEEGVDICRLFKNLQCTIYINIQTKL